MFPALAEIAIEVLDHKGVLEPDTAVCIIVVRPPKVQHKKLNHLALEKGASH